MTARKRLRWYRSMRTKILAPSAALFILFTVVVIVGATQLYTQGMEKRLVEKLDSSGSFLDAILHEEESRAALHVRFMADMVLLAEQFSGNRVGRSSLVYLLDYLREAGMEVRTFPVTGPFDEPFGPLIRKGMLGIRASDLVREGGQGSETLCIASVAPIERTDGIREVIVGINRLGDDELARLSDKLGVDVTLLLEGRVIASTFAEENCRRFLAGAVSEEMGQRVLDHVERVSLDLQCAGTPHRVVLRPVHVGFTNRAICALSLPTQGFISAKRRITRDTLLAASLMLVSALAIYSFLIRRITQPIKDLAGLTRRVGERDFAVRVPVTTHDEIGELEVSYNSMIERLAQSEGEVEALHRRELERADRLATIGELASGIAHEVRNPLAGISGAMQILKQDIRLDDERKEIVEEILTQITRMEKLTLDLLEYSKPSTPQMSSTNLHEIMDKVLFLAAMGGEKSNIAIRKNYAADLPEVLVDPEQIQQALLNVLLNATQALPNGGTISVSTRLRNESAQPAVLMEIADDGIGMSRETLDKATRPFFTTKHRGTGLGLSIVSQIMKNHAGTIEFDSAAGKGTRIVMTLPLKPADASSDLPPGRR